MCTVPGLSCKTRGISRCVFVGDPRLFSSCVWVSGEVCSGLGVKEFYELIFGNWRSMKKKRKNDTTNPKCDRK